MWIFVVTSFTRYNKIGRENQKKFEKEVMKDGFYHLHSNLYVRYCVSSKNAVVHFYPFITSSFSSISCLQRSCSVCANI